MSGRKFREYVATIFGLQPFFETFLTDKSLPVSGEMAGDCWTTL